MVKAHNVFLNLENRGEGPEHTYLEAGAEGQGESSDEKRCCPPGRLTLLHLPKGVQRRLFKVTCHECPETTHKEVREGVEGSDSETRVTICVCPITLTYLAALQNSAAGGVIIGTAAARAASSYEGLTPPVLPQVFMRLT